MRALRALSLIKHRYNKSSIICCYSVCDSLTCRGTIKHIPLTHDEKTPQNTGNASRTHSSVAESIEGGVKDVVNKLKMGVKLTKKKAEEIDDTEEVMNATGTEVAPPRKQEGALFQAKSANTDKATERTHSQEAKVEVANDDTASPDSTDFPPQCIPVEPALTAAASDKPESEKVQEAFGARVEKLRGVDPADDPVDDPEEVEEAEMGGGVSGVNGVNGDSGTVLEQPANDKVTVMNGMAKAKEVLQSQMKHDRDHTASKEAEPSSDFLGDIVKKEVKSDDKAKFEHDRTIYETPTGEVHHGEVLKHPSRQSTVSAVGGDDGGDGDDVGEFTAGSGGMPFSGTSQRREYEAPDSDSEVLWLDGTKLSTRRDGSGGVFAETDEGERVSPEDAVRIIEREDIETDDPTWRFLKETEAKGKGRFDEKHQQVTEK